MKLNRIVMAVVVCALMTVAAYAADLNGSFVAKVEGKNGTQEITYTFKVDGKTLTGKVTNARGDVDIKDGMVDGNTFSFSVERPGRDGGAPMVAKYTGKIDGDTLTIQAPGRGGTMEQKAERKK